MDIALEAYQEKGGYRVEAGSSGDGLLCLFAPETPR